MRDELKVLFLAAEATPFTKVGGLADVAGALPKALRNLGVDVRLMIPRYGNLQHSGLKLQRVGKSLPVPVGSDEVRAHLLRTESDGVPVYLIWNDQYFSNRERVYGFNDDPQRFLFFCRAVISALRTMDWTPDLVHANDWHMAAVPVWLDVYGRSEARCADIATVFTIHNLAYQGECGRLILTFGRMDRVPHLSIEPPGKVNWMAQGIAHADFISTMSSTYAREILTPEFGMGLHELLQEREDRLYGILSGIDTKLWNPETDEALTQSFDVDSLNMRAVNKTALQNDLRLPAELNVPLLGMVTRLDGIKGLELVGPALRAVLEQRDVQFVLLGTGDEQYAEQFRALQSAYPRHIRALIKFDERVARRIYGSADIFLAPSRSEPVSLGQMTAMRYGAVPVVRATGGLADTVVDVDAQPDRGTGFVFRPYETSALVNAIERALQAYGDKARWSTIQRRVMGRDFSWNASAHTYVDLYRRARAVRQAGDGA